jgi:hypothetical protein
VDQPFAIGRVFGGEGNRGLGVEASWLAPLPWSVEIFASATDSAGEATARSFFGAEDLGLVTPLDLQLTVAVKQFFPLGEDWSLLWGLSAATGPNPTGHRNHSDVWGTDLYLKWRPMRGGRYAIVSLQTEWFYRRREVPGDLLQDLSGYAFLFWRFSRRWRGPRRRGGRRLARSGVDLVAPPRQREPHVLADGVLAPAPAGLGGRGALARSTDVCRFPGARGRHRRARRARVLRRIE